MGIEGGGHAACGQWDARPTDAWFWVWGREDRGSGGTEKAARACGEVGHTAGS